MENTRSCANDPVNEEEFLRAKSEFWDLLNQSEDGRKFVESMREQSEYWRKVNESGGFDIEDILPPQDANHMMITQCPSISGFAYPPLIDLYAELGLHRYNILEGTNLGYRSLVKYSYPGGNPISSYYITILVVDPVSLGELPFQVCVKENEANSLNLRVSIARPKGNSAMVPPPLHTLPPFELNEWPSMGAFDDRKRFLLIVEESKMPDWIRLYLKLLLKTTYYKYKYIVQAAIESTTEDVDPQLDAKDVTVYITFKGVASVTSPSISEHHVRKCIVRRGFNQGYFILQGGFSGEGSDEGSSFPHRSRKELSEFLDRVSTQFGI